MLKIAFRARSLRDNLELFDLLTERDRPMIALAMGEFGLMSRVLAGKFGAFLTFASVRAESATAPGQPTLADLRDLYRFRSITPDTALFGVIGHPVAQSLSPLVHNAGFDAARADAVYLPLPVAPGWEPLKATLGALTDHESLRFEGASVTHPHKENALRFAREHSWFIAPAAETAGAVNTIAGTNAANTDTLAIAGAVRDAGLTGGRALVLGAGGAARAAVTALLNAGWSVAVANRTPDRARALATELGADWAYDGHDEVARANLVVNATPVGMTAGPAPADSPVSSEALEHRAGSDLVVFDTVYNPLDTPLLLAARAAGLRTIDGAEMFVRQAAMQLEIWTGKPAPLELYRRIVRDTLTASTANQDP